eukprot:5689800-Amphidinium_carterae.1
MGRLASEGVYSGFESKRVFCMRSDSIVIECRVNHYVPFLDASMTSACGEHDRGHEHVQSVVPGINHEVSFAHGHAPIHDYIKPTYNM